MSGKSSVKSVAGSGINETGVEAFIISCIGLVFFIPAFFIASALFHIFAYAFCLIGIVLGIIALIETIKTKNASGMVFAILSLCVGVLAPTIDIIIRVVLVLPIFM